MLTGITKIFGWGLLIAGIIIIGWTLYSSYNIFTGKTKVPEIFKVTKETTKIPVTVSGKIPFNPAEIQKEMEKIIDQKLQQILPVDILPKLLNFTVWSALAFILIFGGSQISSLGIKLLKK